MDWEDLGCHLAVCLGSSQMLLKVFPATSEPLTDWRLTSVDQLAAAALADRVVATDVAIATFLVDLLLGVVVR